MSVEFDPSRRDLAALLARCCWRPAPRRRRAGWSRSTCWRPSPPPRRPAPDAGAQLETAFDEARRMTVPVFLNGRGPFPFVVDTGANRSVVSQELAAGLGLPSAGQVEVHGIAGAESAALAAVRTFKVGEAVSTGLVLPTLPPRQAGGRRPARRRRAQGAPRLPGFRAEPLRDRRLVLGNRDRPAEQLAHPLAARAGARGGAVSFRTARHPRRPGGRGAGLGLHRLRIAGDGRQHRPA